ncbi:MAG: hypothetical protein RLZZ56_1211 [Actinomycetota bacterium]|jgi:uncharacterized protein YoxC
MSGGDIAAIIAAGALAMFVIFLAVPLMKLGKLLDETTDTVKEINDSLPSLLSGLSETVDQTNKQLAKIDAITDSVADMSNNFQSLVAVFSASVGSPLLKLAGYLKGFTSFLGKKK